MTPAAHILAAVVTFAAGALLAESGLAVWALTFASGLIVGLGAAAMPIGARAVRALAPHLNDQGDLT